ncbi:MAG: hypothetical protein LBB18_02470 [Puniceicoccales bacterium]|jgi:hypothetical protein|nr:hypothetical protein [Puniceicoccales bacterium]
MSEPIEAIRKKDKDLREEEICEEQPLYPPPVTTVQNLFSESSPTSMASRPVDGASPNIQQIESENAGLAGGWSVGAKQETVGSVKTENIGLREFLSNRYDYIDKACKELSNIAKSSDVDPSDRQTALDLKNLVEKWIDSDGDGIPDFLDKDRDISTARLAEDLHNILGFIHEHTSFIDKYRIQALATIVQNALSLIDAISKSMIAPVTQAEQGNTSSFGEKSNDEDDLFSKKKE